MEARVDATLKAKAADGPTLQVSREALLHRQPTPGSIAAAESRLGTASSERVDAIIRGMARVREADRNGDLNACRRVSIGHGIATHRLASEAKLPAIGGGNETWRVLRAHFPGVNRNA